MPLGTASARPMPHRFPSAHILSVGGRLFLIDCGEGAQLQMAKYKIPFARIDNIFISHLHGDHVFGLWGFLYTLDMLGRRAPLHVYGPKGLKEILDFMQDRFGGLKFELAFCKVECSDLQPICGFNNLDIYAFPLKHRVETYGYLFKEKEPKFNIKKEAIVAYKLGIEEIARLKEGQDVVREDGTILSYKVLTYKPFEARSFAYCSDTAPFKRLKEWVKGVTLLYHEATYASDLEAQAKVTLHSTAAAAARCAAAAGAEHLVLGHFSSRYKSLEGHLKEAKAIFENSVLAVDGLTFNLST